MDKNSRRISLLIAVLAIAVTMLETACGKVEKHITVITRELGSGTREAFDQTVTDGKGNFLEGKVNGKNKYYTIDTADVQRETGTVRSKVAGDVHAIGYISIGSVDDSIKTLSVNGVVPTAEKVLDGSYPIQRPFVIMTTSRQKLTARAADFLAYLQSSEVEKHAAKVGCTYLADPAKRANEGEPPIAVTRFSSQATLPEGDKIVINGSTSVEKFISEAMKGYAGLYSTTADKIFTLDLQGSSVGKQAVQKDKTGNVIGLSSAKVVEEGVNSFNVCLDAVAVIVNKQNGIDDLTLAQLYAIYTGRIQKFNQITGER